MYLKELRKAAGLSQGDLSKLLKYKSGGNYISSIESGASFYPLASFKKLAKALNVSELEIINEYDRFLQDRLLKKINKLKNK